MGKGTFDGRTPTSFEMAEIWKFISLSCYDCGTMFDICVGASDSEISKLDGLYDFDSIDKKRYELHKKRIEAERLAFNPNIRRKQYFVSEYGCYCRYPF